MTAEAKTIVLTKPTWPPNDPFWKFWNHLHGFLKQNYETVETFNVSPGLSGKKQTERYIVHNNKRHDIIFAHHIDKRFANALDYKMSYLPDLFYFGNHGYNAFSNICDKDLMSTYLGQSTYDDFYDNRIAECIRQTKYVNDNTRPVESHIPQNFLFVPLQVENDTVMKLKSIATTTLIDHAIAVAKELDIPLVVKVHPKSPKNHSILRAVKQRLASEPNCFFSTGDVRALLDRCIGVMTISSGVGFEALLRLKPVFTYVKCDYAQGANPNSSLSRVVRTLTSPVDENLAKQFLYHWWQEIIDIKDPFLDGALAHRIAQWRKCPS